MIWKPHQFCFSATRMRYRTPGFNVILLQLFGFWSKNKKKISQNTQQVHLKILFSKPIKRNLLFLPSFCNTMCSLTSPECQSDTELALDLLLRTTTCLETIFTLCDV